jgi:hypothetical protein
MAITVNYVDPVQGTAPPTHSQAAYKSVVQVDVGFSADTDTGTDVVHNFGITKYTDGSTGNPMVFDSLRVAGALSCRPVVTFIDGNKIHVVKSSNLTTGSTGTFRLTIMPRALPYWAG